MPRDLPALDCAVPAGGEEEVCLDNAGCVRLERAAAAAASPSAGGARNAQAVDARTVLQQARQVEAGETKKKGCKVTVERDPEPAKKGKEKDPMEARLHSRASRGPDRLPLFKRQDRSNCKLMTIHDAECQVNMLVPAPAAWPGREQP